MGVISYFWKNGIAWPGFYDYHQRSKTNGCSATIDWNTGDREHHVLSLKWRTQSLVCVLYATPNIAWNILPRSPEDWNAGTHSAMVIIVIIFDNYNHLQLHRRWNENTRQSNTHRLNAINVSMKSTLPTQVKPIYVSFYIAVTKLSGQPKRKCLEFDSQTIKQFCGHFRDWKSKPKFLPPKVCFSKLKKATVDMTSAMRKQSNRKQGSVFNELPILDAATWVEMIVSLAASVIHRSAGHVIHSRSAGRQVK